MTVDGWNCNQCTYHHRYPAQRCMMCNALRVSKQQMRDFVAGKKVDSHSSSDNSDRQRSTWSGAGSDGSGASSTTPIVSETERGNDNQCRIKNDSTNDNQSHCRRRRPRILLGITGSIAAVKGPKLALLLARGEVKADVKVVLTRTVERYFWKEGKAVATYDGESWREFLAATSTSSSSSFVVGDDGEGSDDWRLSDGSISIHYAEEEWANYNSLSDSVLHIDLRNWADICLIAPLSAHTLAKIANGLCDDLLTCCVRAWDFGHYKQSNGDSSSRRRRGKPVVLAPAMNTAMWDHPLTRMQLETIQKFAGSTTNTAGDNESKGTRGVSIVEPAVKTLACGEVGAGALAELDDIICAVRKCLEQWNDTAYSTNRSKDASKSNGKDYSSAARKESMKQALLLYAKQRFGEMKLTHEQQNAGPNNASSSQLAAPISPTPNLIIESFLPRLDLRSDSLLVDLGCGDGRWLIAANKLTKCRCLGIDIDEERLKVARESISKNGLQGLVRVRCQDVFQFVKQSTEMCKADVIIIYLFREVMAEMGNLLHQRLLKRDERNGSNSRKRVRILSVGFSLPGWATVHEEKINGIRVYLYSTTNTD